MHANKLHALQDFSRDVRYALQGWRRTPLLALTAITTIGLGIGAAASVFNIVDSVFLRSLPVPTGDRLLRVYIPRRDGGSSALGLAAIRLLRERVSAFDAVVAHESRNVLQVQIGNRSVEQHGAFVSANYWSTLDIQPRLGRFFLPAEDSVVGRDPVVVVSSAFWHNQLADDPAVLGRHLRITGRDVTIVGVAPEGFEGIAVGEMPNDVWLPTMMAHLGRTDCILEPHCRLGEALARLAPGARREQAMAQVRTLEAPLSLMAFGDDSVRRVVVAPAVGLSVAARRDYVGLAQLLTGIAAVILLIACANLSGLLIARGAVRHREMAIRVSLGASRWRLARQLLTESLLIAVAGGVVGLLLSAWVAEGLMGFFSTDNEGFHHFFNLSLDFRAVAFALLISLAATVLFGLLPALTASRADPAAALKSGALGVGQNRVRSLLVGAQVTLSILLLTGALLLSRSFSRLMHRQAFDADHVALLRWRPDLVGYSTDQAAERIREIAARLRGLPNVESVAFRRCCGLLWSATPNDGTPVGLRPAVTIALVQDQFPSPQFFATLHVPLLAGREFTDADREGTPRVSIVTLSLARRIWGEMVNPSAVVGRALLIGGIGTRVVGVVPDFHARTVLARAPLVAFEPYWQTLTGSDGDTRFAVRVRGNPAASLSALQHTISSVDPGVLVTEAMPMEAQIAARFVQIRLGESVLLASAGLALLLTAMGLYGVIAFLVARRTREIGVRLALGAPGRSVAGLFVMHGMRAAMIGASIGLVGALAGSRLLTAWLIDVPPNDVLSFASALGVVVVVSLLASYLPARSASRTDPAVALRAE